MITSSLDNLLQRVALLPHHSIQHFFGGVRIVNQPDPSRIKLRTIWTSAPSSPERAAQQLQDYLQSFNA
jgi:hypothetical protein